MLADLPTTPSSSELGIWLLGAFVVLNGLATLVMLIKSLRNDSEKREVTINPNLTPREEFDRHVERNTVEHDQLHSKLSSSERGGRQLADEKFQTLNTELLKLTGNVAEVKALNESQNQRIAQIDAKLDRLIERKQS